MDDGVTKHTLLLVDGDPKSMRVLEVSLKKAGFAVVTAPNGVEALATLERSTPELIISDTHMPEMDGFELCRRIKERPQWVKIPFIFLSSRKSIEDKIRGLELGVEDYLYKPIYIKEITTRVRILLQRQQRESLESHRETRTRFAGTLADIGVVDLVQTIDVNRKSGIVHVANADGRRGAMYFRDGRVIDAEAGRLSGIDAVYRMFTWSDGSFEVEFKQIRRRDVIDLSSQALLMEGMRRLDEWTRMLETLPPLSAVLEVNYFVLAERLGEIPDEVNRILRLFDGRRTFLQVIEDSDFLDLETVSIVGRLQNDHVVYQAHGESPSPPTRDSSTGRLERWLAESPWAHFDETPIPEPMDVAGPAHDSPTLQIATLGAAAAQRAMAVANLGQTLPGYARAWSDPKTPARGGEDMRKDRIVTSPYGMPAVGREPGRSDTDETPTPENIADAHEIAHAVTDTFVTPPSAADTQGARAARVQSAQMGQDDGGSGGDERSHARASGEIVRPDAMIARYPVEPARAPDDASGEEENDDDGDDDGFEDSERDADHEGVDDTGDGDDDDGEDETNGGASGPGDEVDDDQAPEDGLAAHARPGGVSPALAAGGTSLMDPASPGLSVSRGTPAERARARRTGSARLATPAPSYAAADGDSGMSDTLRVSPVRHRWPLGIAGIVIGVTVALVLVGRGGKGDRSETVAAAKNPGSASAGPDTEARKRPNLENTPESANTPGVPNAPALPSAPGSANAPDLPVVDLPEAGKPGVAVARNVAVAVAGDAAALEKNCRRAYARQRYQEIVAACEALLGARPGDARTMVMLAHAELDRGDTAKTVAWAKKAIAIDAGQADAYVFLGGAEQELGHKKAARAAYQKYLQVDPTGKYAGDLKIIIEGL